MTNEKELETLWQKSEGGFRGGILERIGERNNINPFHTQFAELPQSVRAETIKAFTEAKAYFTDLCLHLTKNETAGVWTFEFQENHALMVTLRHLDRELSVTWNEYGKKHRYHVSGRFPHGDNGAWVDIPSNVAALTREITAADTKTPDQLARDIIRRLLPTYDTVRAAVAARINEHTTYSNTVRANVERLCTSFGVALPQRDGESFSIGKGHHYYGDVRVSGNSCDIHVRGISIETAEKLAVFLREADKEK